MTDRKRANLVRHLRTERGWSQQEIADRAGISRQVVASIEADRHAPSVTVALALAEALGTTVEAIFAPPMTAVSSTELPEGATVMRAKFGSSTRAVNMPNETGVFDGWGLADGVVADGQAVWFDDANDPAFVVVGCDPILPIVTGLAERRSGQRIVCTHATTEQSISMLTAGTAHAALVHGKTLPTTRLPVTRWHVAKWQVGLAAAGSKAPNLLQLAERNETIVQRAPGAGSQASFRRALTGIGASNGLPGPIASSHIDVARRLASSGRRFGAGVTMEAAALAFDLAFAPLEAHRVELWIDRRWVDESAAIALLTVLTSNGLTQRAAAVGGYDMSHCGTGVKA